ncbi:MAG: glycine cleavage system protein R [Proteobacteria bacterium]|nr:glycine cleavage system protein R [Pseudomonadota bacterium]
MEKQLVVTFCGPDRSGIVSQLSGIVARHKANWEESRMATLAGQFAGILKVAVDSEREQQLIEELSKVDGLSMFVERGHLEGGEFARDVHLELTGADHEGIVSEVCCVLAEYKVNIEEMSTDVIAAPMSGEGLFMAEAVLRCPPDLDLEALEEALEFLADDLVVEIALE